MATYNSSKITNADPARSGIGELEQYASVTLTAAAANGDILNLFKLPAGATVLGICASCTDIDTNGTPTVLVDIGDADDADRLMVDSQIGRAATLDQALATTGHLYQYAAETTIFATLGTVATGATGTLKCSVRYTMNQ